MSEQHSKPNVANSVARSVKRVEERIASAEIRVNGWLNNLESAVRLFTQSVLDRLDPEEEDDDSDDE